MSSGALVWTRKNGPATPSVSASIECPCSGTASTISACCSKTISGFSGSFRGWETGVRGWADTSQPNPQPPTPNTQHPTPMLIPTAWLREYVSFDMELPQLAERLTMAGLEVEAIHATADDTVLDVYVTPN